MMMAIEKKNYFKFRCKALRPHVSLNAIKKAFLFSIYYQNKNIEIINVGLNKNNFTILELAKKIAKLNHITNIQINSKTNFLKTL